MILEVALVLAEGGSEQTISFCAFDPTRGRYNEIGADVVKLMGQRMRGAPQQNPLRDRKSTFQHRAASSLATRALRPFPGVQPHLRRAGSHALRAIRETAGLPRALKADLHALQDVKAAPGSGCVSANWSEQTTYCSIGMDWLHNDLCYLRARQSAMGFRCALMVHDLLPEVAAQFSGLDMTKHYVRILELTSVVLVNSDATERDLRSFAAARQLAVPEVIKLPMGSALLDLPPVAPSLPDGTAVPDSGYILCVGTITIRKNHQLLFDVWEELIAQLGPANTPPLIVVGAKGWLSDETMSRLTRTPSFAGIVHHITNATDENIAWLYQHCTFTVYPSLYEGWGLPVSESHDFGKMCLTTNTSSLPEAGEGLAELLHPHDRSQWTDAILRYWNDTTQRTTREQHIHTHHHHITAHDSANTILQLTP